MESGYYPEGTENNPDAPWNKEDLPNKEIEVTVSITLSKTVKIKVNDYKVIDEDNIDFSTCCLNEAVEKQVVLPQNLANVTERMILNDSLFRTKGVPKYYKEALRDCKNWNVDEIETILE